MTLNEKTEKNPKGPGTGGREGVKALKNGKVLKSTTTKRRKGKEGDTPLNFSSTPSRKRPGSAYGAPPREIGEGQSTVKNGSDEDLLWTRNELTGRLLECRELQSLGEAQKKEGKHCGFKLDTGRLLKKRWEGGEHANSCWGRKDQGGGQRPVPKLYQKRRAPREGTKNIKRPAVFQLGSWGCRQHEGAQALLDQDDSRLNPSGDLVVEKKGENPSK